MKRNVLIYGIVLGILLCISLVIILNMMYNNPDFKGDHVTGYASMVVIFSLIFFGIRNYRNRQLNGYISFSKAFKTGVLIALAGSTIYVIFWLFYYYLVVPDFLDVYIPMALKNCQDDPAKLEATTKQMETLRSMYKNPLFIALITYMEVLPVGLVVALVSSLILKKKAPSSQVS